MKTTVNQMYKCLPHNAFTYSTQTIKVSYTRDSDNDKFADMQSKNISKNLNDLFEKRKEYAKAYMLIQSSEIDAKNIILDNIEYINKQIKILLDL